jgi:hypothetical protein
VRKKKNGKVENRTTIVSEMTEQQATTKIHPFELFVIRPLDGFPLWRALASSGADFRKLPS